MDPIRRTTGASKPQDVAGATPAAPASGVSKPFEIGAAGGVAPVEQTRFNAIAGRIRDGLARRLDRDAIMREVVEAETRERFGPLATPAMTASVAESFRSDPGLVQLVAKLFAAAG
ncbi:MAG: hypothetical protein JSR77_08720 [Planctomycetes bacterium]|nr:hypothetical protein [Planctomycetota bacterium]